MNDEDIIGRAMDMERMSRDYYRELSRGSISKYAGGALEQLALEEQSHMDVLAGYRRSLSAEAEVKLPGAGESRKIWQRFTAALNDIRQSLQPHSDEITVVQRGIDLENRGLALYNEAQQKTESEEGKVVFAFLADQEVQHRAYLETLLKRLLALYEEPPETRPQL